MPEPRRPGLDLDTTLFGRCELALDDFAHAIRHEPRTRALLRWATGFGSAGTALGVWLVTTADVLAGAGTLVLGLSCFAAHNAPDQAAARWFQRMPREARSLRFTINADGLIVVSDISQRAYPWHSLEGYHPTPESFLVWVSGRSFLILPKRAFASGDLQRISSRLEREVGAPPELPRFWSWLLLGVALTLGLLWLWNTLDPR